MHQWLSVRIFDILCQSLRLSDVKRANMDVTELHDEENLLLRQTLGMGCKQRSIKDLARQMGTLSPVCSRSRHRHFFL